jgi:hypothetical protein
VSWGVADMLPAASSCRKTTQVQPTNQTKPASVPLDAYQGAYQHSTAQQHSAAAPGKAAEPWLGGSHTYHTIQHSPTQHTLLRLRHIHPGDAAHTDCPERKGTYTPPGHAIAARGKYRSSLAKQPCFGRTAQYSLESQGSTACTPAPLLQLDTVS